MGFGVLVKKPSVVVDGCGVVWVPAEDSENTAGWGQGGVVRVVLEDSENIAGGL